MSFLVTYTITHLMIVNIINYPPSPLTTKYHPNPNDNYYVRRIDNNPNSNNLHLKHHTLTTTTSPTQNNLLRCQLLGYMKYTRFMFICLYLESCQLV